MLKNCLLATSALVAAFVVAAPAHADSGNLSLADRVRILEDELAKSKDYQQDMRTRLTTLEQNANDVKWSFDNGRPTIKSGDGRFKLAFRARLHFDYAGYDQNNSSGWSPADMSSGAVVRRFYFGVEGNVFKDFDYELRFNFGDGGGATNTGANINIARVAYVGIPHFKINVGIIQPIFTLDDATSSNDLLFLERAAVVSMLPGAFGASDSRRGVELTFQHEDMFYPGDNVIVSGAYTGDRKEATHKSSATVDDEGSAVLGRVAYRLWSDGDSNIQVGGSASKVLDVTTRPKTIQFSSGAETSVDTTALVDTSKLSGSEAWTYGYEAGANWNNFYVQGEYYRFGIDRGTTGVQNPSFSGWYAQAGWIVTGEKKGYAAKGGSNSIGVWGAPKVVKPFSPGSGSWGAVELKARYSVLDLNYDEWTLTSGKGGVAGGLLTSYSGGVNWYLNNNIRLMFDYDYVTAEKGTASTDINVYQTRLSFAF